MRRLVKGGGISRVDRLQIVADLVVYGGHVVGVIPHVGIVTLVLAVERGHVQFFASVCRIGLQEFIGPGIIASTVDDDVLGINDRPRISSSWLVAVGVGIGINNNAGDMHMAAADLGSDTAPKVFSSDELDGTTAASSGLEGGATGGQGKQQQEKNPRQGRRTNSNARHRQ